MKTHMCLSIVLGLLASSLYSQAQVGTAADTPVLAMEESWHATDIGPASVAGQWVQSEGGWDLRSSGIGLGDKRDSLAYVHRSWGGDGQFTARIIAVRGTGAHATGGLMVRRGVGEDAPYFFVGLTCDGHIVLASRMQQGDSSRLQLYSSLSGQRLISAGPGQTGRVARKFGANCWVKVKRQANQFSAFVSDDNATWYWLGTERVELTEAEAEAGLVAAGFDSSIPTIASFQDIELSDAVEGALPAPVTGSGNGLAATYGGNPQGSQLDRVDSTIDFEWGLEGPAPRVGVDLFRATWEGLVEAQFTETYAITLANDERARLWIDGRLLLDERHEFFPQEKTVEIQLVAGRKYPIRLEYIESWGEATVRLFWSSPSTPRQIVPREQLYAVADQGSLQDSDGDRMPDIWESRHGLDPASALDGVEDSGKLGIQNYKRYLADVDMESLIQHATAIGSQPGVWQSRDVGIVGVRGSSGFDGKQGVVSGSGKDIFACQDGFQFVFQPWRGDVQIVGRIDLPNEGTDFQAKAGLTVREDLTDRSKNVLIARLPWNGLITQHRTEFAGRTTFRDQYDRLFPWIRLVRRGDAFELSASMDGKSWAWLNTEHVVMDKAVYVGLAVCSHNDTRVLAARFRDVQISVPKSPLTPNAAAGLGDGLQATYSDSATGATVQRIDPTVDFDWQLDAPAPGLEPHQFVALWEGQLEAPFSDTYEFRVASGAPLRLWVDGQLLVDEKSVFERYPADHDFYGDWLPVMFTRRVPLKAAHQYSIKLECRGQADCRSVARLYWSSPGVGGQAIPQALLYSPANPCFGHLPDQDRDGMPDSWERAYGLNPNRAADAKQDPDHDGLTNLQEYQAGSNPSKADSNEDGIPDRWAAQYGLPAGGQSIAHDDPDGDGLTNLQELQLGTDPTREDTDGDGLPDLVETTETITDPVHGDIESVQTASEVAGSSIVSRLGGWAIQGSSVYALSRRGYVEYELGVTNADMYRLEIWGAGRGQKGVAGLRFPLILTLDGDYLGRKLLGASNSVFTLTPWLQAGTHRLRVYWDNGFEGHVPLEITSVKLVALKGKDRNNNGMSDWIESRLETLCGLNAQDEQAIESYVSPCRLEGRERYLGTLTLTQAGRKLVVQPGVAGRWYADVQLAEREPVVVDVSFENGALKQSARIAWVPVDLKATSSITVRRGDSLLLSVAGKGTANEFGVVSLAILGVTNYTGTQPIPVRFDQAGTFTVIGKRMDSNNARTYTLEVRVVDWSFEAGAAAVVGASRSWGIGNRLEGMILEAGAGMTLQPTRQAAEATEYEIGVDDAIVQYVVARLGKAGPMLDAAPIKGLRLMTGWETGVQVIQEYSDGSQLVEMGIVMSPVLSEVRVNVRLVVGGVLFEDGTFEKNLTAKDFNELGEASVRFLRPLAARTSVCHRVTAYDGSILIGGH